MGPLCSWTVLLSRSNPPCGWPLFPPSSSPFTNSEHRNLSETLKTPLLFNNKKIIPKIILIMIKIIVTIKMSLMKNEKQVSNTIFIHKWFLSSKHHRKRGRRRQHHPKKEHDFQRRREDSSTNAKKEEEESTTTTRSNSSCGWCCFTILLPIHLIAIIRIMKLMKII